MGGMRFPNVPEFMGISHSWHASPTLLRTMSVSKEWHAILRAISCHFILIWDHDVGQWNLLEGIDKTGSRGFLEASRALIASSLSSLLASFEI